MRPIRAISIILLVAGGLHAANLDELKRNCDAFTSAPALKPFVGCLTSVFTYDTIHPIVQSIVPGGGIGLGAQYKLDSPRGEWHRIVTVKGAISLRDFWMVEPMLTLRHPKFGGKKRPGDEAFSAHVYLRARNLPRMPYYGLGPHSSRDNLVNFRERDIFVGADVLNPVTTWLAAGAVLEFIRPDVGGVHKGTVRSVDQYFTEATAPGLFTQPNFIHSEVFVHPHHRDPFEFDWHIGYNFYHDTDTGRYSFRRFRADLKHNIYLERSGGIPKRDSVLSIRGLLSMSDAGSGNAIPFYMQETLGGSDIHGDAMLRGFADYRFRGPNLVLLQTQYERRLWSYFGVLGFYDAGQVAIKKDDLSLSNMRQSFGFGISLWAEARVVFRAYVGLGSGEGRHTFIGIPGGLL